MNENAIFVDKSSSNSDDGFVANSLGKEIPPLGASQGRAVNKKLIVAMVAVFVLFVGGVIYGLKAIKPGGSPKPAKAEAQVVEDPPERKRIELAGVPVSNYPPPIPLASRVPSSGPVGSVAVDNGKPQLSITDKRAASGDVRSGAANAQVSSTTEDPKVLAMRELVAKRTAAPATAAPDAIASKQDQQTVPNNLDRTKSEDGAPPQDPCNLGLVSPEERRRRNSLYGCDKQAVKLSDENLQAEFTGVQARRTATKLSFLIPRGANISCVMDQRVISDFEGQVSCTIPSEIYSMDGKNRLLPKGSRLLGTYRAQGNKTGLDRLAVVWDRVRTPYGVDIEVSNPGTDPMGSAGIPGRYEGYYWQKISTGLWLSAISDLFKYAEYKYAPKLQTVTVIPGGGTVVTEQPFDSATVQNLSKISEQTVGRLLDRPGSIIVEQGQLVNTVVTKDISFEAIGEVSIHGR